MSPDVAAIAWESGASGKAATDMAARPRGEKEVIIGCPLLAVLTRTASCVMEAGTRRGEGIGEPASRRPP
ncbi:hypothetical protein NCCP2165_21520 [Halomonas sp. NCCP-2165]|nr:hypothetical protein NCCP2165_21520 [Halomonas sp. NCCP-2165]